MALDNTLSCHKLVTFSCYKIEQISSWSIVSYWLEHNRISRVDKRAIKIKNGEKRTLTGWTHI